MQTDETTPTYQAKRGPGRPPLSPEDRRPRKQYRRADFPDETAPTRAVRIRKQNDAVAARLGYDTMADLVGALRGALVNAQTEADVFVNLGDLLREMNAANERHVPSQEAMYDAPADLAAIMEAMPRKKAEH